MGPWSAAANQLLLDFDFFFCSLNEKKVQMKHCVVSAGISSVMSAFFFFFCRFCILSLVRPSVQSPPADVGEPVYGELYIQENKWHQLGGAGRYFFLTLPLLSYRGMFTPVEGRREILSSDPPPSFPPSSFYFIHLLWETEGEVNLRSCCHFNASGVFSPPSFSSICLCLCVCERNKKKRTNV